MPVKTKKAAGDGGIKRVERWQTTDGQLWETELEAEAAQAVLSLLEALAKDAQPLDIDKYDALRLGQCLQEDAERYIGLLRAVIETRDRADEAADKLLVNRHG